MHVESLIGAKSTYGAMQGSTSRNVHGRPLYCDTWECQGQCLVDGRNALICLFEGVEPDQRCKDRVQGPCQPRLQHRIGIAGLKRHKTCFHCGKDITVVDGNSKLLHGASPKSASATTVMEAARHFLMGRHLLLDARPLSNILLFLLLFHLTQT